MLADAAPVAVSRPPRSKLTVPMTLLSLSCSRGPAFIAVALPDGRRRLIRRAATNLEQPLGPLVVEPRLCTYHGAEMKY